MTSATGTRNLRIGAFSAFYGDRPDGMEILLDNDVHILVGDYLAELTMLILRKAQMRGGVGYAKTFVSQLKGNLTRISEQGVKVIANAGGLDPEQCAADIRALCREQGVDLVVAAVVGDDLRDLVSAPLSAGLELVNIDTGDSLDVAEQQVMTANAYLGAWPIVRALEAGADIVVCPRMTDASLVVGPAAWHFGWSEGDWDQLAAGVVAGHLIECGGQLTGGNFGRFYEHPNLGIPGLPIAEIEANGDFVVTKSKGSGGIVNSDTVKAQLFYEIGGVVYQNPDVRTDLSSIQLTELGSDAVRASSIRGYEPTPTTKLALTFEGGYRNSMTIGLTGAHVDEKVRWLRSQIEGLIGGPDHFDGYRFTVIGPATQADGDYGQSTAMVVITARDRDAAKVSRRNFSDRISQICIASIPGFYFTAPPGAEKLFGVQWPCLIGKEHVNTVVRIDGCDDIEVPWGSYSSDPAPVIVDDPYPAAVANADAVEVLLGEIACTRSGDKGGSANLGVWTSTPQAYVWLREYLTVDKLAELLPELRGLTVERTVFPNLLGVNFVIREYLEFGVSSCTRIDAQAKGLGEYLAAHTVSVPRHVLHAGT